MSVIVGWEPPNEPPATCASWLCRTCGHRLYEHSVRKEPNSGLRFYSACGVGGCDCRCGENHRYPRGQIDT